MTSKIGFYGIQSGYIFNENNNVVTDVVNDVTCSHSVNTRDGVVITLFIHWKTVTSYDKWVCYRDACVGFEYLSVHRV